MTHQLTAPHTALHQIAHTVLLISSRKNSGTVHRKYCIWYRKKHCQ